MSRTVVDLRLMENIFKIYHLDILFTLIGQCLFTFIVMISVVIQVIDPYITNV